MNNTLVKLIGWQAIALQADPTVFDRLQWLKRHLQSGSLRTLDAGCGAGLFTLYAASIGNQALGLSFDEHLNQIGQARAELLHLSTARFMRVDLTELNRYAEQLGQFDQIICFETIEHILDDHQLMQDLAGLLSPGGQLLLTTPYKNHPYTDREILSLGEDGGHVRHGYTFEEMNALLDSVGLKSLRQEFLSGLTSQHLAELMGRAGRLRALVWGITFPLRLFGLFDRLWARLFKHPYLCIAVIGVKPA